MKKNWLSISGMHDGATPNVFRNAARLRISMTEPELKLWGYLKTKPLGLKFRRQHPISGYILDFYCHKQRLSIEIDGEYHIPAPQKEKDKERTEYLYKIGIKEIRFANEEVIHQFEKIIQIIEKELSAFTPTSAGERTPL